MSKLIEGKGECLDEYKEAYLLSMKKINEGLIKKHDLMFYNPDNHKKLEIDLRRYWRILYSISSFSISFLFLS